MGKFPRAYTKDEHETLGTGVEDDQCARTDNHPGPCLIDRLISDATLNTVFQGFSTQLSSVSEEKGILLSELIALQDNFIQEQCMTTVLVFLTNACVLQLILGFSSLLLGSY